MEDPSATGSSRQSDEREQRKPVLGIAGNHDQDRFRRNLSLAIPVATLAVVGIYVLVWLAGNSNPTLRASPADQQLVRQAIGVPVSTWQSVGTGGLSDPWHAIQGQPLLTGPHGHPEFFYVGGEFCEFCATERWAILGALSRFGTFSDLSQLRSYDEQLATFTFYQSTYVSPYVDFVPVEQVGNTKDILGQFVTLQQFRSDQKHLFDHYASAPYLPTGPGLPFIDLNNQYVLGGGLDPSILQSPAHEPLSWREIVRALADPSSSVARHVLGTANYLTAAICLVTNQQPRSACQVPIIQQIESGLQTPPSAPTPVAHKQ
jgi:hypothetical protein